MTFDKKSRAELIKIAGEHKDVLKGYSTMKKEDLVKAMKKHLKMVKGGNIERKEKKIVPPKTVLRRQQCWNGYEPVPGKEPFTKGSCKKVSGGDIKTRIENLKNRIHSSLKTLTGGQLPDRVTDKLRSMDLSGGALGSDSATWSPIKGGSNGNQNIARLNQQLAELSGMMAKGGEHDHPEIIKKKENTQTWWKHAESEKKLGEHLQKHYYLTHGRVSADYVQKLLQKAHELEALMRGDPRHEKMMILIKILEKKLDYFEKQQNPEYKGKRKFQHELEKGVVKNVARLRQEKEPKKAPKQALPKQASTVDLEKEKKNREEFTKLVDEAVKRGQVYNPFEEQEEEFPDVEGIGINDKIDWEDMKWGSFTEQLQQYNRTHAKPMKDLKQLAEHVLANPQNFKDKTKKRARFYLNVILKKKSS